MADVFLSHASVDLPDAERVAKLLEEAGYSVWWDRQLVAGERFQQSIQRELGAAAAVVVLWTPASVVSEWVYSEARRGHQREALVQLRTDGVHIDDLPAPFDALHCPLIDDTAAWQRAVAGLVREPGASAPTTAPALRERKVITVLIADLELPAGLDVEDAEAQVSAFRAALIGAVEGYGGTVEPMPGHAVLAAFGAPRVHEDDPERAVRAALRMVEVAQQLNATGHGALRLRVGIATGEALVSAHGTTGQVSELAGEVLTTAGRLVSAAHDTVLVDEDTYAASRATIRFEPAEGTDPAWVAIAGRGSTGEDLADRTRPMIGRAEELTTLERSLGRATRESSVQLVTVVAEPGLGKSRLVQAFFDWIEGHEMLVTWRQGKCLPYGDAVAFAPVSDMVKAQTGILDSDDPETIRTKLEDTVTSLLAGPGGAEHATWLVARLAPLVGLATTEAPQEELFTAWARFLEALAATGPTVLVVEDLHWAEQGLLDFMAHLLEYASDVPLLVVATARPELYAGAPAWGAGHPNSATLTLAPLDDTDTAGLIASLIGSRVLPPPLQEALVSRAAGNPLYAREYLAMLAEDPERADDTATTRLVETMPASVQAVIAARLDTLPVETKRLLQAAAVVGPTFWSGAVTAVTATPGAQVRSRLQELVRRDFLRRARASRITDEDEYTFGHALIVDVAYSQLPRAARGRDHRAVADWQASRLAGSGVDADASPDAGMVAHHYTRALELSAAATTAGAPGADLGALAARWHAHAAAYNRTRGDLEAATRHIETSLAHTPAADGARPARLMLLGEVQRDQGLTETASSTFEQARAAAAANQDVVAAARAQAAHGATLAGLHLAEGQAAVESAIAVLEAQPPGLELVDATLAKIGILVRRGQVEEASSVADAITPLVDRLDVPPSMLCRLWSSIGVARVWSGDRGGVDDLRRALAIAEAADLVGQVIRISDDIGSWGFFAGDLPLAARSGEAAVRAAAMTGRTWSRVLSSANYCETLVVAGDLETAAAFCREAGRQKPIASMEQALLWANWAWAELLLGQLSTALRLLEQSWELARDSHLEAQMPCLAIVSEALPVDPSNTFLADRVQDLTTLLEDPGNHAGASQFLTHFARFLGSTGQSDVLEQLIEHAATGLPYFENNVLHARAVLALVQGLHADALALHEAAASAWRDFGYPVEEAHALVGAARAADALGRSALPSLEQARLVAGRIGAATLTDEIDQLLAAARDGAGQLPSTGAPRPGG